jgi:DNA-binding XRE family transcriptional regulator
MGRMPRRTDPQALVVFTKKFIAVRKDRGYTQAQVARILGVSPSTLNRFEKSGYASNWTFIQAFATWANLPMPTTTSLVPRPAFRTKEMVIQLIQDDVTLPENIRETLVGICRLMYNQHAGPHPLDL